VSTGAPRIVTVTRNEKFDRDFKSLPPEIQLAAKEAIEDVFKYPIPASRRFHVLQGFRKPKVFTIDVLANHAYKISFEIDGQNARLRRIGTHKTIDRSA
jgi:predicted transcriptional regulator